MKQFVLLLEFCLLTIISLICAITLILSSFYLYLNPDLPPVSTLRDTKLQTPLKVFSQDGKLITEFGEKRRIPLPFAQVPNTLRQAILAAEDDRFYSHQGVSLKALGRATFDLISTGHIQSGGSTITMQVAKNFFLSSDRTFIRKFNEIILALQIEDVLSKQEILELYINKIYLGHRAYGFGAAAQVYYGKPLTELELPEFAMLAGLPKSPSRSNPVTNPERALSRRNWILDRMLKLSSITQEQHDLAIATPVVAGFHTIKFDIEASYIAEMVRLEMLKRFGKNAYTDGYTVYTTLDSSYQASANKAVRKGLIDYDQRHGYRGPVSRLDISKLNLSSPEDIKTITSKLKRFPETGNFQAALISSFNSDQAIAILKDESEITLDADGITWARPFISVNSLGPPPKNPTDVFKVGDIVYVASVESPTTKEKPSKNESESTNDLDMSDAPQIEPEPILTWSLTQIPKAQGALISLDPNNGAMLALVGGFDYSLSNFNRILQAQRQAGSNFKPFIYSAALENGFTAASIINDAPVVFEDSKLEATWRPENSSGKFFGPTRLRRALYKSRNLVSIRLLRSLGIKKAINYVEPFGFDTSKLPKDLSLALGSAAITPLEIATGYAVLANGGYKIEPYFIDRIVDNKGSTVFQANPAIVCRPPCVKQLPLAEEPENKNEALESESLAEINVAKEDSLTGSSLEESLLDDTEILLSEELEQNPEQEQEKITPVIYAPPVMDPRVNYIINSILRDVITKGTGRKALQLGRSDIGGKTGTTNNQLDAWFSGFNTTLVTTAWVGFDNPQTLGAREYGAKAALPIWLDYMTAAMAGSKLDFLPRPDGLITMRINSETGEAALPGQNNTMFETFREEYAPKKQVQKNISIQNDELIPEELF